MSRTRPVPDSAARGALVVLTIIAVSCAIPGPDDGEPAPAYDVSRSATSDGEFVQILAGSKWGPAALREIGAIGAETGDDPYLFGRITAAWATPERTYLIDEQVPVVRAFDDSGNHLFDFGSVGQGPGEYQWPSGLAADANHVYVADPYGARASLFDHSGRFVEDWSLQAQKSAMGLTLGRNGLFTRSWSTDMERMGIQQIAPGGLIGEIDLPPVATADPLAIEVQKGLAIIAPYSPGEAWAFAPGGEFVAGAGHTYEFIIRHPQGHRTRVTRYWEPEPVAAGEAAYRAALATREMRRMFPGTTITASDLPSSKPAFESFHADREGRVWVRRLGAGRIDPACVGNSTVAAPGLLMTTESGARVAIEAKGDLPVEFAFDGDCWVDSVVFDLYDLQSGDFLTTIAAPEKGFGTLLYADANAVLASVTDDLGTVRLKRYRLVRADES